MGLSYPNIRFVAWLILIDSFRLFSSSKVADLVQLGAIPDGKRDDVCSKVQEIDYV